MAFRESASRFWWNLLASCNRPVRLEEMAIAFAIAKHGESKLDVLVAVDIFSSVGQIVGDYVSASFVIFWLGGSFGRHPIPRALWIQISWLGVSFPAGAGSRDARRHDHEISCSTTPLLSRIASAWMEYPACLILFYVACSFGVLINLETAEFAVARASLGMRPVWLV